MDLDLKIKRIPTTPRGEYQCREKAQGRKMESRISRPAEVPPLNLGRLGDWEEEDVWYVPTSRRRPCVGPPDSSSTLSWGPALSARSHQAPIKTFNRTAAVKKKPPPWEEEKVVPENLPPPSERYRLQYQQYQRELRDSFKQQTQTVQHGHGDAAPTNHQPQQLGQGDTAPTNHQPQQLGHGVTAPTNHQPQQLGHGVTAPTNHQPQQLGHGDTAPTNHQPQQLGHGDPAPTNHQPQQPSAREENLTAQDERALLQQCYTGKPYTLQHSQRKLEAEDLAVLRRKQAVVEQVMVDQLSRAVISDPDQNLAWAEPGSQPGASWAPLRFKKRTLHETRNGRDASRELIGFFFAYDKTLTVYEYRQFGKNRTNALPFIPKGCYKHEVGRRKGAQYSIHDFYVGANLSFSTNGQNLPENMKQLPLLLLRITDLDELAKDVLLASTGHVKRGLLKEERDDRNTLTAVQEVLQGSVRKRGVRTLTGLGKLLRGADTSGEGLLGKEDFHRALEQFHLTLPDKDLDAVWRVLDQNSDGRVDYRDFIRGVIGEMNEFRKSFVRKAYVKLDPNKSGSVPMTGIEKFYCAKGHPKVVSGESTEAELRAGFMRSLQDACLDSREVSYCEFEDYYEGLSIGILHDQDFANVLKNSWGI